MKRWQDDILAFVCGDALTVQVLFGNPFEIFLDVVKNPATLMVDGTFKVLSALVVGLVGGGAGLLGKDIYVQFIKPKIFKNKNNQL